MGCNCGKKSQPKVAMTSAQLQATASSPPPRYQVTHADGSVEVFGLYVDARRDQVHAGGTLKELR